MASPAKARPGGEDGEDATGEGAGGQTIDEGDGGGTIDTGNEDRRGVLGWFTGKRLAFIGAGLVAAIVLAIVLGSLDDNKNNGGSASPTSPASRTAPVVVDGASPWTDTGFDVAPGDRIQVQATGLVFHDAVNAIGPNGERSPEGRVRSAASITPH